MRIGVLGSGGVGRTLALKLMSLGHEAMVGSREAGNKDVGAWIAASAPGIRQGTFAETARFGEMLISCTSGTTSIDALRSCERGALAGKVLIDVSNPLDFSKGMAGVTLTIAGGDSLGETLQREFPELKVVKALNTCNQKVMVDPGCVPGEHDLFMAGNEAAAKEQVTGLLRSLGWRSIIDLGDISGARGMEALLLLWLRLYGKYGPEINFKIAGASLAAE